MFHRLDIAGKAPVLDKFDANQIKHDATNFCQRRKVLQRI